MKILCKNEGLLTNFEMCELLRQRVPPSNFSFVEKAALNDEEKQKLEACLEDDLDDEEDESSSFLSREAVLPQPHEPFETELQCLKELILQGKGVLKQSAENVKGFLEAIEPIKLTETEKVMLVNMKPKTSREVKLIVEHWEERMQSEAEAEDLINLIEQYLS